MSGIQSYAQGYRDTCVELGDTVPDVYESVDVSEESLVLMEYMRGQIAALVEHVKKCRSIKPSEKGR